MSFFRSIFGGGSQAVPPPTIIAPPPMPVADDQAVQRSKRASLLRQRQRSGRASTILSNDAESDTLG